MNEPKDFLSRWSERKLNPPTEESAPSQKREAPPATAKDAPAPVPAFDITTLPPLESITAQSDVRVFLQAGVPATLRDAALRRAWSADPAIRDFVGLSENSWDFTAPDSLPGFGPMSAEEVRQAAARFLGVSAEETEETSSQKSDTPKTSDAEAATSKPEAPVETVNRKDEMVAAAQQEEDDDPHNFSSSPRRHGSALPK